MQFDSSPTQSPCGILKWSKENWLLIGSLIPEKGVYTNATILKIGAYSANSSVVLTLSNKAFTSDNLKT